MNQIRLTYCFLSGLLIPFGFAPFHLPGLAILGIALLFLQLENANQKHGFLSGFIFGLGFFGLGVSWIYISIHDHGYFHPIVAAGFTLLFVAYLSLFTGLMTKLYGLLRKDKSLFSACMIFSALWCGSEVLRSTLFGGFPWLLLGFGQMDSPLNQLLPVIGVYGVSFISCCAGSLLASISRSTGLSRIGFTIAFVLILILPSLLKNSTWTSVKEKSFSVGIVQANLSMRDKWDESLFWNILDYYEREILDLVSKNAIIVLPEAAIPLPTSYLSDFLESIDKKIHAAHSALLLGIPHPTNADEESYYNAIISLGQAEGVYFKQHLVPFGEFTPEIFKSLSTWLG